MSGLLVLTAALVLAGCGPADGAMSGIEVDVWRPADRDRAIQRLTRRP